MIHTRRPLAWAKLSNVDAAFLDFLRQGGKTSELTPKETIKRMLTLVSQDRRFERLLQVADSEPPRVRAILGAIGEELRVKPAVRRRLRKALNPHCQIDKIEG